MPRNESFLRLLDFDAIKTIIDNVKINISEFIIKTYNILVHSNSLISI